MKRYEIDSVYYDGLIGFEQVPPMEANAWTVYERKEDGSLRAIVDFFFTYENGNERERARALAKAEVERLTKEQLNEID